MIVGGFQEPAHGAANSLHGLFTRPDQAARVAADPAAWSGAAVDEGLRWLAPFSQTEKLTTADVTVGGALFPEGTEVSLVLGSANRDETRYDDPDVFDLDRPRLSHVAFGFGLHFCLGHYVARHLEQVMLEEMFAVCPISGRTRTTRRSCTAGRSERPNGCPWSGIPNLGRNAKPRLMPSASGAVRRSPCSTPWASVTIWGDGHSRGAGQCGGPGSMVSLAPSSTPRT